MRQHKILTRALLILSAINFTLATPVAIRWKPEKRQTLYEGGSMNVPIHAPAPSSDLTNKLSQIAYADTHPSTPTPDYVPDHAPPASPDFTNILDEAGSTNVPYHALVPSPDFTNKLSQIAYADTHPSSPAPDYYVPDHAPVPSPDFTGILNEGGSTNIPDHALAPSPDSTNILSQITYADTHPSTPTPDYVQDHAPPPSPDFITNTLSQIAYADTHPSTPTPDYVPGHAPPPSPNLDDILEEIPPHPSQPGSSDDRFPPGFTPLPPPSTHPSQPGPSDDRFPPGFGFSSLPPPSTHPSQPGQRPPQSPGVDPNMDFLRNPETFLSDSDFWEKLMKDRFKRRMSGSDAVNLARKDTRSLKFPRRRHDTAMPLHGPLVGRLRNRKKSVSRVI